MSWTTGTPQGVDEGVSRKVSDLDLELFRSELTAKLEEHERQDVLIMPDPKFLTIKKGRKYARFIKGTSIY